jgi:hypothetical protein
LAQLSGGRSLEYLTYIQDFETVTNSYWQIVPYTQVTGTPSYTTINKAAAILQTRSGEISVKVSIELDPTKVISEISWSYGFYASWRTNLLELYDEHTLEFTIYGYSNEIIQRISCVYATKPEYNELLCPISIKDISIRATRFEIELRTNGSVNNMDGGIKELFIDDIKIVTTKKIRLCPELEFYDSTEDFIDHVGRNGRNWTFKTYLSDIQTPV